MQDGLAGDAALEQRRDRRARLAPRPLEVDLRVELAGGDERREPREIAAAGAGALDLLEDEQAVQTRAGRSAEQRPRREADRFGVAGGERDDDAAAATRRSAAPSVAPPTPSMTAS